MKQRDVFSAGMTFHYNKRPARSFFGSNRTFCIAAEGYCVESRSVKICHNIALELNAASAAVGVVLINVFHVVVSTRGPL